MQYLFPHQEIIDNINNSRLCLILQVLTPSQSLLHSSNRMSIHSLASRPRETGQAFEITFINANQRCVSVAPNAASAHVPGTLFLESGSSARREQRRRTLECMGKFTRGSASTADHGGCTCLPALQFAHQEDCALHDVWQPYPFLFVKIHAVLVLEKEPFGPSLQICESCLYQVGLRPHLAGSPMHLRHTKLGHNGG